MTVLSEQMTTLASEVRTMAAQLGTLATVQHQMLQMRCNGAQHLAAGRRPTVCRASQVVCWRRTAVAARGRAMAFMRALQLDCSVIHGW